jgi:hypothetical protein
MVHYRYRMQDEVFGIEHRFDLATDSTPWHLHENGYGHAVQLVWGKARLEFEGFPPVRITKEERTFNTALMHRIFAEKSGTLVFNRLYPTPADWRARLRREGDWQCL